MHARHTRTPRRHVIRLELQSTESTNHKPRGVRKSIESHSYRGRTSDDPFSPPRVVWRGNSTQRRDVGRRVCDKHAHAHAPSDRHNKPPLNRFDTKLMEMLVDKVRRTSVTTRTISTRGRKWRAFSLGPGGQDTRLTFLFAGSEHCGIVACGQRARLAYRTQHSGLQDNEHCGIVVSTLHSGRRAYRTRERCACPVNRLSSCSPTRTRMQHGRVGGRIRTDPREPCH